MTTPITTWRIPRAAWIMVGLAVSAEATSNALRAYDLGSHLEKLTVSVYGVSLSLAGIVLVLAAIAVSLSQTRAAWVALTPGDTRQRIVAGIAACLLLSISITAMASHILSAQRAKVGDETKDRNGYHDAKQLYDAADAEWKKVRNAGTVAEAQAAITAARAKVDDNIWRRTDGCTDATAKASKAECKTFRDQKPELDADLAKASRKAELEAKLPGLKADLDRQHLTSEASASEATVSWGWAWIMGIGVVMIATFGPAIFAKVETVAAPAPVEAPAAPAVDVSGQSDFPDLPKQSFDDLKSALTGQQPNGPGAEILAFPGPNGSPNNPPNGPKPGKRMKSRKVEVLADIRGRIDAGEQFASQEDLRAELVKQFGPIGRSTLSDWLKELAAEVERTTVGRRKVVG
ncbi:hypothetical protein Hden_2991 [Hyphomicrobium denitrificans ATCC 51888]|uniref:Uncharacterized protein n=1 Tax=Hyphomicrobium denitrificans (strain ATCC 51888 / DSM 1869 / NCIMB 11706 / TK 0415) TaxID=582899 RepID=D8JVD2_HYPDA|nr:hypothetical protein [Hyphomicrobium denitrificans]ADJ24786.1 hypothetical protein Hden_2991 [Hyphomicrobium denitrificans ATCC 51888]